MSDYIFYNIVEEYQAPNTINAISTDGNDIGPVVDDAPNIASLTQTPNYLYATSASSDVGLVQYEKDGYSLTQNWTQSDAERGDLMAFASNGDPIKAAYYAGARDIARYSKTDGSLIWKTSWDSKYTVRDITRLDNGNPAVLLYNEDTEKYLIRDYDATSGDIVKELQPGVSQLTTISRDSDDNYVVCSYGAITKIDRNDGSLIWENTGWYDLDQLSWDGDRYYAIRPNTSYGDLIAVTNDGALEFQINSSEIENKPIAPFLSNGNKGVALDISSDELLEGYDGTDGSVLWTRSGNNRTERLPAYPSAESFPALWGLKLNLSGTVVNQGSPVSGAKISIIDDDANKLVATTETDSNGEWSAIAPKSTIHVVAQYKDSNGDEYNVKSYPYITGS